jgi:hypothetical protein
MYHPEIRTKYIEDEIVVFPIRNEFPFDRFSQIMKNLFENKIVYYEKFLCVATLKDIKICSDSFLATAIPHHKIEIKKSHYLYYPSKPWNFGSKWSSIRYNESNITSHYAGWTIWPGAERVQLVEECLKKGDFDEALQLTIHELKY